MPQYKATELKYSNYMRRDMEKSFCKACAGLEVLLHAFLTSALHAADWTASYPSRFIPTPTAVSATKLFPLTRHLYLSHTILTYLPTRALARSLSLSHTHTL
jgi:hypothetical protein